MISWGTDSGALFLRQKGEVLPDDRVRCFHRRSLSVEDSLGTFFAISPHLVGIFPHSIAIAIFPIGILRHPLAVLGDG